MKTLLVLAAHPDLADHLRGGLDASAYRVLHRLNVEEAAPFLEHGLADACIVDAEVASVRQVWLLEKVRRLAPDLPVVLYLQERDAEVEEAAYLQGAAHVFAKPAQARVLAAVLERLWAAGYATPRLHSAPSAVSSPAAEPAHPADTGFLSPGGPVRTLTVLRDVSGILTHSLNAEGLLRQFLLMLRDILGVNRAAIFLRQPFVSLGAGEDRRLRAVSSMGLSTALLQHFELSFESGIGGHLFREGRILRRSGGETGCDADARKEFELLGVQVAIPILDRESVIGAAVFDGRITGEPLLNAELELIFHLLEQVGLAVKNIWLHDQLAGNHAMMAEILRELNSACIVVSRDLEILHANKTARRNFGGRTERRPEEIAFADLPQVIGARIYQVLKTGAAVASFRYESEEPGGSAYSVTVAPFHRRQDGLPASVLLIAEDLTQAEQLRRLEVEAANLRLIRTMADRLTHEIGNAMVPIWTYMQLFIERWKDADFRESMVGTMGEAERRVNRLLNQTRYLARDNVVLEESFPLGPLVQEAFQEACKYQPAKSQDLKQDKGADPGMVRGDRAAIRYALTEVLINALQANPTEPKVRVKVHAQANGDGRAEIQLEIQDNGDGFTPEGVKRATEPFWGTRNVGLGLGLTVTRRIIETHRGRLELLAPGEARHGLVRISLPVDSGARP